MPLDENWGAPFDCRPPETWADRWLPRVALGLIMTVLILAAFAGMVGTAVLLLLVAIGLALVFMFLAILAFTYIYLLAYPPFTPPRAPSSQEDN